MKPCGSSNALFIIRSDPCAQRLIPPIGRGIFAAHNTTAMNTFIRKHNTGLITFAIYFALTAFALAVTFGG